MPRPRKRANNKKSGSTSSEPKSPRAKIPKQHKISDLLEYNLTRKQLTPECSQRAEDAETISSTVKLPNFLMKPQDILQNPMYKLSTMSRTWLNIKSNFEESVLNPYYNLTDKKQPKEAFVGLNARRIYADPRKSLNFHFHQARDQALFKELLINPDINNFERLNEFKIFMNQNRLRLVDVPLHDPQTNPIANSVKQFQIAVKENRIRNDKDTFKYFILQEEYAKNNKLIHIHVNDLTIDKLMEISNLGKFVLQFCSDDEGYREAINEIFREFKGDRIFRKNCGLKLDPQYVLIGNVLTKEEEDEISSDIEIFYKRTNAKKILKRPENEFTREELFTHYISLTDDEKKLRPFQILVYYPPRKEKPVSPLKPTTSRAARERLVERSPTKSTVPEKIPLKLPYDKVLNYPIPENLLVEPKMDFKLFEIFQLLAKEEQYIRYVKIVFYLYFGDLFEEAWKNHKVAMLSNNLIAKIYYDDDFEGLMEECQAVDEETKKLIFQKCIEYRVSEEYELSLKYYNEEDNPLEEARANDAPSSSSAGFEILANEIISPARQSINSSSNPNRLDVVMPGLPPSFNLVPIPADEIKKEKFTQILEDSDCVFAGVPTNHIEISDDESPQTSATEVLAQDNDILKRLEDGSQQLDSQNSLKQFEPRKVQRRNTRKRFPGKNAQDYINDSDDSFVIRTKGNVISTSTLELNDEFSVFLSSQIAFFQNDKRPGVFKSPKEVVPFTYSSSSSSFKNHKNLEYRTSFNSKIKNVEYKKDEKFEVSVDLRHFNLFDCIIAGDSNIQQYFQLSEEEFSSFKYFFDRIKNFNLNAKRQSHQNDFEKLFNLFLEYFDEFNTFSFKLNDRNLEISPVISSSSCSHENLKSAINPKILKKMKAYKC